ncbi:Divalent-cation tolerance protein CutA [Novipirellula aureliae]|uniref:Divalent-cation tolerance protein CutA n=1 Tax=Novipirellula aureliae TaxID=2527966 RepID=A0A5C6DX92_9BACT|nr:divalent-cation tolerance protein CutA [Novipirellula aureliae]TWU41252.1 Divalent-cation tolerance protein CutA [Novipirellula aureliae]
MKESTNPSIVLVLSTVGNSADAERLAKDLISQSLAACVQIDGPLISHYRWAGKVEQGEEFRLSIKTSLATWPKLRDRLQKEHPYDEPQIVMIPIVEATEGYRDWVIEQTS